MGFFNDKQVEAFETGRYICSECGAVMEFEDKWEGGVRLIRGLRMTYICIQTLRSILISGLELARMAFIRL